MSKLRLSEVKNSSCKSTQVEVSRTALLIQVWPTAKTQLPAQNTEDTNILGTLKGKGGRGRGGGVQRKIEGSCLSECISFQTSCV